MSPEQPADEGAMRLAHALPRVLHAVSGTLGTEFLQAVAIALARAADAGIVFIGRHLADTGEVRTLAMAREHREAPNVRYTLAGTPCAEVLRDRPCTITTDASSRFPDAVLLRETGAAGYVGVPLRDGRGAVRGLVAALYHTPIPDADPILALLELFGPRIAAEMERVEHDAELRHRNAELEHRVAERTAELTERSRDLRSCAHTVSHELRAPLRAIETLAHAIEEDYGPQLAPEPRTRLARIRRHAGHARRIALDLTHFSLAAVQTQRVEPVDVVPLFIDAVEALRPPTPAVVIEHPERCTVEADPVMLGVIVHNLVSNAIKYAMKRAEIRVVLGVRPGCSFYVRDNGCGFPQSRATEIFLPFHRLHDSSDYEGTGIGLATVARIVSRHAGRVWAEGEPGWGATVYVALPPAA